MPGCIGERILIGDGGSSRRSSPKQRRPRIGHDEVKPQRMDGTAFRCI